MILIGDDSGSETLRFDIHASVVFRLGEELVTDEVQALVELVKNSYDADSTYCNVVVDSNGILDDTDSFYNGAQGIITIEDKGIGMNLDTIERGWLTISNSIKREMKKLGQTTKKGRTPLGDKGLGRLAVQILGKNIEIYTYPEGGKIGYHVGFSWKDFQGENLLTKINVQSKEITHPGTSGTKIVISDICSPGLWQGDSVEALRVKLSSLISPYQEVKDFRVVATVNGKALELTEIAEQIRDTSFIRYTIDFNKTDGLHVLGKYRLAYLKPYRDPLREELFCEFVEKDGGKEFFEYLHNNSASKTYGISLANSNKWFIQSELIRPWIDITDLEKFGDEIAYPGPFHGEIDYFHLVEGVSEQDIFNQKQEYSDFIKQLSGIRVYRDGFGIRVASDWLGLSKATTGGTSWYGLRPENTTGFIAITAKYNSVLEETSNRESFKDSPYFYNFYEILQNFVRYTGKVQEFIRRELNEFLKEKKKDSVEPVPRMGTGSIIERLQKRGEGAKNEKARITKTRTSIKDLKKIISDTKPTIDSMFKDHPENGKETVEHFDTIEERIRDIDTVMKDIENSLDELSNQADESKVILLEIDHMKDQLAISYETMGLGLTAEAITHEMANVVDRLYDKTHGISKYLKSCEEKNIHMYTYVESVKTSLSALRKQLSHIAPSLKYVRERKDLINIKNFWVEEQEYYANRFISRGIKLEILQEDDTPFVIRVNKGKFVQIIDNIFLNSEYWVKEAMENGVINEGKITVDLQTPYFWIWDNGRGVDPSVEDSLFEPFISCKGKEKGRGLGLFIVTQLLDSDGCNVELQQERNVHGRRYKFKIDWGGVLNE